jgi:chromosome segregation ATPase
MSSRKTAKGAKVDKAVHDQLAAELDASKQEIVRLKEENKEEKKENKASLASVAKLTKAAEQNKKGFDQNSLTIAKMKLDIASKRERIKSLSDEVAELKKRNKAEQKEESREENVAAKEATKQAKRSAFKVQHMQAQAPSMFLPSVLSAFLQGRGPRRTRLAHRA